MLMLGEPNDPAGWVLIPFEVELRINFEAVGAFAGLVKLIVFLIFT